jgi:uracil-DNA glycosylase
MAMSKFSQLVGLGVEYMHNPALAELREMAEGRLVLGVGPVHPVYMFVGEAPGAAEARKGIPFIGPAGQFLRKVMGEEGINPDDCNITNVVKYRPIDAYEQNRPPTQGEIDISKPYLWRELAIVNPEVVVMLGNVAKLALLPALDKSISQIHGRFVSWQGRRYFASYHPSWAIRGTQQRGIFRKDMRKLVRGVARMR